MKKLNPKIEILYLLIQKELRVRYKNSYLGYLWAIANPICFSLIYYFAFHVVFKAGIDNYLPFVLVALFPWLWISSSIQHASNTYRSNISLVKKVSVDRWLFPLSCVGQESFHFIFSLPIVFGIVVLSGYNFNPNLLWLVPVLFVLHFLILSALAIIISILNAYIHDTEYIIGILLSILFYLTPIVYSPSMIPSEYRHYLYFNPFFILIESWRMALLEGSFNLYYILYLALFMASIWIVAIVVYKSKIKKIAELL